MKDSSMPTPVPIPAVLTVTAVSTVEPTDEADEDSGDSWMAISTVEQGRLLLHLPGDTYRAVLRAAELPADRSGPGRLTLTSREIAAYRRWIAQYS